MKLFVCLVSLVSLVSALPFAEVNERSSEVAERETSGTDLPFRDYWLKEKETKRGTTDTDATFLYRWGYREEEKRETDTDATFLYYWGEKEEAKRETDTDAAFLYYWGEKEETKAE